MHPGIINGKDWVAVQNIIEKNRDKRYRAATGKQKQTIVSGLLKCKICGYPMRPRNMDKRRADGSVNYRYCCNLKEKSKGKKCNCKNISGEKLDNTIIKIIKETVIPNFEIYEELKKMTIIKDENSSNKELELLEQQYKKNEEETNKLIEKLKYLDIDLIDMVNNNLRKLKEEKENLKVQINNIRQKSSKNEVELKIKTTSDILKIIDNSFDIFEKFDLKTKRDIANLFIENIRGEGENIEINFLNTKIEKKQKELITPIINKILIAEDGN